MSQGGLAFETPRSQHTKGCARASWGGDPGGSGENEGKEMHGKRNRGHRNQGQGGWLPPPKPGGQEEGPKGRRPEAKGLCAGGQEAAVESVWAYGQRGSRIGLRPEAKQFRGRQCLGGLAYKADLAVAYKVEEPWRL